MSRSAAEGNTGMPRSYITASQALAWASAVLVAAGVESGQAADTALALVRTSLRGIDTHGLTRLPGYVAQLRGGALSRNANVGIVPCGASLLVDGDLGLAPVVMARVVDAAIERLPKQGVVSVFIRRAGHFGCLGTHALRAAEAGYVMLLCQQTPAIMALPDARGPAIGNNPIAMAFPIAGRAPFVFDMALSAVARGRVVAAVRDDESIPDGWAIDSEGVPTSNAVAALAGAMLPFGGASGGHKGIGLAMIVQLLAGSLAGAAQANLDRGGSVAGVGAFALLIDPSVVVGRSTFDADVAAWLVTYADAVGNDRYPGSASAQKEVARHRGGIPISFVDLDAWKAMSTELNVPFFGDDSE